MWITIARKEILVAFRSRSLHLTGLVLLVLLLVAAVGGFQRYRGYRMEVDRASSLFRSEWTHQHANPHSAAHFGTYLFRPIDVLSLLDPGINDYTGTTYRVEGHYQHQVQGAPAEEYDTLFRFGDLHMALVFQWLVPLAIIMLSFNAVCGERESQTLKMIFAQGVKPISLIWGKIVGGFTVLLIPLVPVALLLLVAVSLDGVTASSLPRLGLLLLVYGVFFFMVNVMVCLVSALCRTGVASLMVSMSLWMIFCVVMPRVLAAQADERYPLPSRYAFNAMLEEGFSKGLDGDGSRDERYAQYRDSVLRAFGRDSLQQLPMNFDGLSMQQSEDYQSKVFQRFNGQLTDLLVLQQNYQEYASLIDPFIGVQQLSMALCGTDLYHHLAFHEQARRYRDEFIRVLNMETAYGDSTYLSYEYQVGPDFFEQMADFNYKEPTVTEAGFRHRTAGIGLVLGFILIVLATWPVSLVIRKQ